MARGGRKITVKWNEIEDYKIKISKPKTKGKII